MAFVPIFQQLRLEKHIPAKYTLFGSNRAKKGEREAL